MKYIIFLWLTIASLTASANSDIEKVLDSFHQAASDANYQAYFSLLDDNAVFLGTDATERWSKQTFAQYVQPYFAKGQGWTYIAKKRNISQVNDELAFFDEILDNNYYGECRGTGVLVKRNGLWRIMQYNLSVAVPNKISKTITDLIKQHNKQH